MIEDVCARINADAQEQGAPLDYVGIALLPSRMSRNNNLQRKIAFYSSELIKNEEQDMAKDDEATFKKVMAIAKRCRRMRLTKVD